MFYIIIIINFYLYLYFIIGTKQKKLLDIYFTISKTEHHIFNLIYSYHGCDSWEDIFRDYDKNYLKDKTRGLEIAIKERKRKRKIIF